MTGAACIVQPRVYADRMDNGSFLFAFLAIPMWIGLAASAVIAVFGLVFAINSLIGAVISGLIASHRARRANR